MEEKLVEQKGVKKQVNKQEQATDNFDEEINSLKY